MSVAPDKTKRRRKTRRASRLAVNAAWLLRLRWVAVVGQLITIGAATVLFRVELELAPLIGVVVFTAGSNVGFALWLSSHKRGTGIDLGKRGHLLLVAIMAVDLVALTTLLYFSGGPANPFTIFYFVNLALAAVILPSRWGWSLTSLAIIGISILFVNHVPLPELEDSGGVPLGDKGFTLQQQGLLVALTACAVVVIYFITRVTRELRQREEELRVAEQQRANVQRLEALGTLAAGAGHELATPLSTIAVVANELTRHLEGVDAPQSVIEDVALIRGEVDLCRSILDRMTVNVDPAGEDDTVALPVKLIVDEVVGGLAHAEQVKVQFDDSTHGQVVTAPLPSLAQAIRGVVQNALDVSPPEDIVVLTVTSRQNRVCIEVEDRGPGMSSDVAARAGEPFFTTKQPGKGMGLGLYLTRSVIERLGGSLELKSHPQRGVTAVIELPCSTAESPNTAANDAQLSEV